MAVKELLSIVGKAGALELTFVFVALLITYLYQKVLRKDSRIKKYLDLIPGPSTLPIVGNALLLNVQPTEILKTVSGLKEKYGSVFKIWMFNLPYVVITSAKDAEPILSSTVHINKSRDYNVMRNWLGNSLFINEGAHWAARRKFLTPAFTFGLQDEFLQVFNEQGEIMRKVVDSECIYKEKVNLYPYCFRTALDIICEAAMGTKIRAQTQKHVEYLETLLSLSGVIVKRILSPWLQPNFIWKYSPEGRAEKKYLTTLHKFTENVIEDRKRHLEVNSNDEPIKKGRVAFLDLLLQASKQGTLLTDTEIRNETDLFMAAGHDTSGSALAWTLFLLSHNPECQKKVQNELDEIFGDDPERRVTTVDLTKMKYLEMCFKESLRLRPPIPYIFRQLNQDCTLTDGKVLPAGTSVAISIIDIHMDPSVYPDPEKFDPERFSAENSSSRSSYAFVPFAAGPRSCIGQGFAKTEAKVTLSSMLRQFWFEPAESLEGVQIVPDVNLRPLNGLHFKISRRN